MSEVTNSELTQIIARIRRGLEAVTPAITDTQRSVERDALLSIREDIEVLRIIIGALFKRASELERIVADDTFGPTVRRADPTLRRHGERD